ncbi:MAG: ATP-binding protein [Armatimonadota bacterium]|nr:ATP-binding protein [Armatimonadota bacterium]MDR7426382.1 ATP-binding protein [Armatimonadota bacterium]MDR7463954.1 ATP-binding protein [Armatimonadota bacterium]MDR7469513.1 ATP-binding protein [Armatimonadota bacterium]MDR7473479.1 ATP-binding protein [Armatimonadota bacterium]
MPAFTPSMLLLTIGILEILLGTAVLAVPIPRQWGLPAAPPPILTAYGTAFVVFGVCAFILYVTQPALPRPWRAAGTLVVTLPLLDLARMAFALGMVLGGTAYAALGVVNLAFAGLGHLGERRNDRPAVDGVLASVLLFEATAGTLLLTATSVFAVPIYRNLLTYHRPAAALMLLGAAALLGSLFVRRPALRLSARVLAAVPLALLTVSLVRLPGPWPGLFVYPTLAAFLVARPWLERSAVAQARTQSERPAAASFERMAEGVVWAVILLVTVAGNVQPATANRVALYVLAFGASLFTLVWFRLPPGPRPQRRTLWGTAVYTLLAGLVVHLTGGVRTPLLFLLILPILAAAWALPPKAITAPAVLALAVVGVEAGLHLRRGEAASEILTLTIFRGSGLLFVAVFAYLLARRAAEQRDLLRREKKKLETIVASLQEGLIVLDGDGRIQFCNPAAAELLGASAGGVAGRPLHEVAAIRRQDGSPYREGDHPVTAALQRGEASCSRVLVEAGGGATPHPYALTVTPVHGAGAPAGVICSLRDVAPELEMERLREDFFNIASHEIRTPLTVIKGHVELLLDGAAGAMGEMARHVLGEIHAATARLIRMVNDFLDAARVEQGRITVQIDRGQLPPLVEQAVATLAPDARRKGLTLTYRLSDPAAVPPVLMDAGKALQVLINLIDNAIKFTARGGVEIWHEVEDGTVATYVRDSGAGIRPEERHRLFERFSQLGRGLRRETGGSGLGLYICRRLAEHMNGTVALQESVPGAGSTFVFVLPRAAGSPAEEPLSRPGTETRSPRPAAGRTTSPS